MIGILKIVFYLVLTYPQDLMHLNALYADDRKIMDDKINPLTRKCVVFRNQPNLKGFGSHDVIPCSMLSYKQN
jgi:hypothetical protein